MQILHINWWGRIAFWYTIKEGAGGMLPRENLNFLNIRNTGFSILVAGCKESQFYSLPFGQAVASMY